MKVVRPETNMAHRTMVTVSAPESPQTPAMMRMGARFEVNMASTCWRPRGTAVERLGRPSSS